MLLITALFLKLLLPIFYCAIKDTLVFTIRKGMDQFDLAVNTDGNSVQYNIKEVFRGLVITLHRQQIMYYYLLFILKLRKQNFMPS